MDKFYLQWNLVNWVTVVLMVAIGMSIIGGVTSIVRQYAPGMKGG